MGYDSEVAEEIAEQEWEKSMKREPGFLTLSYEFKTQEVQGVTWGKIKIQPNISDRMYVRETRYKEAEDHTEKMVPVFLSMGNGTDSVLAYDVANGVGGMFYVREKADI